MPDGVCNPVHCGCRTGFATPSVTFHTPDVVATQDLTLRTAQVLLAANMPENRTSISSKNHIDLPAGIFNKFAVFNMPSSRVNNNSTAWFLAIAKCKASPAFRLSLGCPSSDIAKS